MKLDVLTAPAAAAEAGLAGPDGEAPPFRTMAAWLRSTVVLRGVIRRDELVELAATQAAVLGLGVGPTRTRGDATLAILQAAGDLVAIPTDQGEIVVSPPEETVALATQYGYLVGGHDLRLNEGGSPVGVLRSARDMSGSRDVAEYLGLPGYLAILREQGLPDHVDLKQAAGLLATAARTVGEPATIAIDGIWGRLDSEGSAWGMLADGREAVLSISNSGPVTALTGAGIAAWMALAVHGPSILVDGTYRHTLPDQLVRALTILGEPLDDTLRRWRIDDDAVALLRSWARLPEVDTVETKRDTDQDAVVDAAARFRLLVDAPPGSGKTRTACKRVASLVDRGTPPSRIWMISFTRTAVAEMRDRIAEMMSEPARAADIRIVTIDSLAWRLRAGAGNDDEAAGAAYETGIRETTALLESGDLQLLDFIAGIEHLVIDEAQDLSGVRSRLITTLVNGLSPQCGVTVFHDPAQAIYGFNGTGTVAPISETLAADSALRFERASLRTDHRTRNTHLANTFVQLRRAVTDGAACGSKRYDALRSIIEGAASSTRTEAKGAEALVLFRSRAELLVAASDMWRAGRDFRVRFAARREIASAWIGAVLAPFRTELLERSEFDALWRRLVPVPVLQRDIAWSSLRRIAASGRNAVDVRRLAQRLAGDLPPLEVQQTDLGPPAGPLLTTIHGAKGREADEVHLMLSRRPEQDPRGGWDEEARVLFVGATRARSQLVIGSSSAFLRREEGTGRRWQRWVRGGRNDVKLEIGIDGDVDQSAPELAEDGPHEAQALLWRHSWRPLALRAERQDGTYALKVDEGHDEGRQLGTLSRDFVSSLRRIATEASGPDSRLPRQFRGFHMVAARTLAAEATEEGPTFWLAPVIAGLPLVYLQGTR